MDQLVQKLLHPIQEIRYRSLQSLIVKYSLPMTFERYLELIDNLSKAREENAELVDELVLKILENDTVNRLFYSKKLSLWRDLDESVRVVVDGIISGAGNAKIDLEIEESYGLKDTVDSYKENGTQLNINNSDVKVDLGRRFDSTRVTPLRQNRTPVSNLPEMRVKPDFDFHDTFTEMGTSYNIQRTNLDTETDRLVQDFLYSLSNFIENVIEDEARLFKSLLLHPWIFLTKRMTNELLNTLTSTNKLRFDVSVDYLFQILIRMNTIKHQLEYDKYSGHEIVDYYSPIEFSHLVLFNLIGFVDLRDSRIFKIIHLAITLIKQDFKMLKDGDGMLCLYFQKLCAFANGVGRESMLAVEHFNCVISMGFDLLKCAVDWKQVFSNILEWFGRVGFLDAYIKDVVGVHKLPSDSSDILKELLVENSLGYVYGSFILHLIEFDGALAALTVLTKTKSQKSQELIIRLLLHSQTTFDRPTICTLMTCLFNSNFDCELLDLYRKKVLDGIWNASTDDLRCQLVPFYWSVTLIDVGEYEQKFNSLNMTASESVLASIAGLFSREQEIRKHALLSLNNRMKANFTNYDIFVFNSSFLAKLYGPKFYKQSVVNSEVLYTLESDPTNVTDFYSILYHDIEKAQFFSQADNFLQVMYIFQGYLKSGKKESIGEFIGCLNLLLIRNGGNIQIVKSKKDFIETITNECLNASDAICRLEFAKLFSILCFGENEESLAKNWFKAGMFESSKAVVIPRYFTKSLMFYGALETRPIDELDFWCEEGLKNVVENWNLKVPQRIDAFTKSCSQGLGSVKSHEEFIEAFFPLYYFSLNPKYVKSFLVCKAWINFERFLYVVPATVQDFELFNLIYKYTKATLSTGEADDNWVKVVVKSVERVQGDLIEQEYVSEAVVGMLEVIDLVWRELGDAAKTKLLGKVVKNSISLDYQSIPISILGLRIVMKFTGNAELVYSLTDGLFGQVVQKLLDIIEHYTNQTTPDYYKIVGLTELSLQSLENICNCASVENGSLLLDKILDFPLEWLMTLINNPVAQISTTAIGIVQNLVKSPRGLLKLSSIFPFFLDTFKDKFTNTDIFPIKAACLMVLNNVLVSISFCKIRLTVVEPAIDQNPKNDWKKFIFESKVLKDITDLISANPSIPLDECLVLFLMNLAIVFPSRVGDIFSNNEILVDLIGMYKKFQGADIHIFTDSIECTEINILVLIQYLVTSGTNTVEEIIMLSGFVGFYSNLVEKLHSTFSTQKLSKIEKEYIQEGLSLISLIPGRYFGNSIGKDLVFFNEKLLSVLDKSIMGSKTVQTNAIIILGNIFKTMGLEQVHTSIEALFTTDNGVSIVKNLIEHYFDSLSFRELEPEMETALLILLARFDFAKKLLREKLFFTRFERVLKLDRAKDHEQFIDYGIGFITAWAVHSKDTQLKSLQASSLLDEFSLFLHSIDTTTSKKAKILDCITNLVHSNDHNQKLIINQHKTQRDISILKYCSMVVGQKSNDVLIFNSCVEILKHLALNIEIRSLLFKVGLINHIVQGFHHSITQKQPSRTNLILQILLNISATKTGQIQLLKTNELLDPLFLSIKSKSTKTQTLGLILARRLATPNETKVFFLSNENFYPTIQHSLQTKNIKVFHLALVLCWVLLYDYEKAKFDFKQSGLVEIVLGIKKEVDVGTRFGDEDGCVLKDVRECFDGIIKLLE